MRMLDVFPERGSSKFDEAADADVLCLDVCALVVIVGKRDFVVSGAQVLEGCVPMVNGDEKTLSKDAFVRLVENVSK